MITVILYCVIGFALIFEFINGFHDTANAIATSVYTRALTARNAILLAACMNFIGALVSDKVAMTIAHGIVDIELQQYVILAALIGAITWNLFTWWMGIPSSSSHALIGSLIGSAIVYTASLDDILWSGVLEKVIIPLVTSPLIGFFVAFGFMRLIVKTCAKMTPAKANTVFCRLQILSAALVAFAHGNNDAQKTMGIITLALITGNMLDAGSGVPLWVKICCAAMMAFGTSVGGWRVMKTMGCGVTKLQPHGGFVAQTTSALVIELMSFIGAPISTTQVITSSVMGVGSSKRISAVKWGVAKNILVAWVITLPITIALGGFSCFIIGLLI